MQLKAIPLALFLITSFAIATPAFAETSPEDAYDYRHAVMESLGSHAHAFFLIFAGKVDQRDQMATHADAIAAVGAEISTLFPPGSSVDDSHALPLIWEEPEQFSEVVENAETATAGFAAAVATGDQKTIAAGFKALGEACKGCHDRYRADDDHDHD
jgi:cytochrome c556